MTFYNPISFWLDDTFPIRFATMNSKSKNLHNFYYFHVQQVNECNCSNIFYNNLYIFKKYQTPYIESQSTTNKS